MRNNIVSAVASVAFPEPWVAVKRPGVRLCLDEPVEVVTGVSRFCVPVYSLAKDSVLTSHIKPYAHYYHIIKGVLGPDILVCYLSLPRFNLLLRRDALFRTLVLSSPLDVVEG